MKQVRKGKEWYFGMRVPVGTDRRGIVHSLTTTDAAASEINQLPHLVHGEERALYGDRTYWSESDRQACEAAGIKYRMNRRGTRSHPISERWRQINRARSSIRACGEFAFQVVKCQWKYTKVRYRGLAKNTAALYAPMQWPRGLRTSPAANQEVDGTPPADFARDVAALQAACDRFLGTIDSVAARPHFIFGSLTPKEWARWGYLHMDHHLRQFGL
jgi:hypothetical protein